MTTKHESRWGLLARMVPSVWIAVATVIALLVLGAFAAIPPVAADDDGIDADTARYQAQALADDGIQRGIDATTARY